MNRRTFLKAAAATALAPSLPVGGVSSFKGRTTPDAVCSITGISGVGSIFYKGKDQHGNSICGNLEISEKPVGIVMSHIKEISFAPVTYYVNK